jgi:hypothetical protein
MEIRKLSGNKKVFEILNQGREGRASRDFGRREGQTGRLLEDL